MRQAFFAKACAFAITFAKAAVIEKSYGDTLAKAEGERGRSEAIGIASRFR